jgi:putative ABC transport system ATP-binding protein
VAIARATILRPAVLLADEPTGNLDRVTGEEVVRLIETLNTQGMTLIVVTHDLALGARARRQIKMDDGSIVSDVTSVPDSVSGSAPNMAAETSQANETQATQATLNQPEPAKT